jgi:hypothetical protein
MPLVKQIEDVCRCLKPFQTRGCGPCSLSLGEFSKQSKTERIMIAKITAAPAVLAPFDPFWRRIALLNLRAVPFG